MKKRHLIPLLLVVGSLSVSGCSFFNIISIDSSIPEPSSESHTSSHSGTEGTSTEPTSEPAYTKKQVTYTMKDLANRSIYNFSVTPSVGNPKILVVPIWFSNSSDFVSAQEKNEILLKLNKAIFGTSEDTGWHSVSSYYLEESYGLCNISGSVADWYTTNKSYSQINSTSLTIDVVNYAVSNWKSSHSSEVKNYDSDGDGYLDGVIAIYAGPNSNNYTGSNKNENMWAYTSWTDNARNTNDPTVKNFIWASYDFMDQYKSTGVLIDTHTYIHETGHLLGIDDYYDYNRSNLRYDALWAGGFSMQDYNVGGHDPYSKLVYGWVEPYVPTKTCTITIRPFESTGDVVLLSPNFTGSPFDEYLLFELYTPTGVNQLDATHVYNGTYSHLVNGYGIRLWHVDSRLLQITNSSTRSDGTYYPNNYTITTEIESGKRYSVGPTNTTYVSPASSYNGYASKASELRSYKLLDLIRRNDTSGFSRGEFLDTRHLFRTGDSFNINRYSDYFINSTGSLIYSKNLFNNDEALNWSVSFDEVTLTSATITFTYNG